VLPREREATGRRVRNKPEKWPFRSNLSPAYHREHNPIGGFPHVCCAVNNRSRDNGFACFSPRAHHPSGRASFETDARRQVPSLAAIQAKTSSASLMASPHHASLKLSAPAALLCATAGHHPRDMPLTPFPVVLEAARRPRKGPLCPRKCSTVRLLSQRGTPSHPARNKPGCSARPPPREARRNAVCSGTR